MGATFSKEERAAMRAAVAEEKAAKEGADLEAACRTAIDAMTGLDRELAEGFHALVAEHTDLRSRTWYGMPAYIDREGRVVTFFQAADKFKGRYATIGFQQDAKLDEGHLWPTSFAVTALTDDVRQRLIALLERAAPRA
jgi:uncharacterized protein YdhG (YjbR/CyaY superfamily)